MSSNFIGFVILASALSVAAADAPRAARVDEGFPVIHSRQEYDALPFGSKYWYNGRLSTKDDAPIIHTRAEYDALPVGAPYWYNGQLNTKTPEPTATPTPTPYIFPTPTPYVFATPEPPASTHSESGTVIFFGIVAIIIVIIGLICRAVYARKPKPDPQPADHAKRAGQIYHDDAQFQLAMRVWDRDRMLFEQNETSRLAQLNEAVKKKGGPVSCLAGLGSVIAGFWVGGAYGAGQGVGIFFLGMFMVGIIMSAEEQFYRWRHASLFVRREFTEPQPVWEQQPRREPPPKQEAPPPRPKPPPPRPEPPPPKQEPPPSEPVKVTSMQQAYQILGLPAGKVTISEVKAAYKQRMLEYHPDRVSHLGPELQELAKRKALLINLAMEFISSRFPR